MNHYRTIALSHYRTKSLFSFYGKMMLLVFFLISGSDGIAQGPAKDCNLQNPDYHITTPTTLTSLMVGGGVNSKSFVLDEDLIIDTSVYFTDCLFKVAPNKRIKITSQNYILFFDCNLYSCNDKWFGIEVVENGTFLSISYSTIENAINGVNIDNKSNLVTSIYKNNFYNNHIGILIQGSSTFVNDVNFGNKFHGSPVSFKKNVPFQKVPAYGIKIVGGTGFSSMIQYNIGNWFNDIFSYVDPNEFYNLYISGVYLDRARTVIHGARFYNFYDIPASYPYSYAPVEGAGITTYNSELKVSNLIGDPYPTITFENLEYGIYAKSYGTNDVHVEGVHFKSCATSSIYCDAYQGFDSFICLKDTFDLEQNSTNSFNPNIKPFEGIHVNGVIKYYDIGSNIFDSFLGLNAVSIPSNQVFMNFLGAGSTNAPLGTIYNNKFQNSIVNGSSLYLANHYGKGLVIDHNVYGPSLNGDTLGVNFHWQMGLFDNKNIKIMSDTFNWAHSNDNIHCQGNHLVDFCNNFLNQAVHQNFHAMYINEISLAKTYFDKSDIGLLLDKVNLIDPEIGIQKLKENCWTKNHILGAKNEADPIYVGNSQFDINVIDTCFWTSHSPLGWFQPSLDNERNQCESDPVPQILLIAYEDLRWESKYMWYDMISERYPMNDYEEYFMSQIQSTGIPKLVEQERLLNNYLNDDLSIVEQIKDLKLQINNKKSQIEEIMRQYTDKRPTLEDSLIISGIMNEINDLNIDYLNILEEIIANREINIKNFIVENQYLHFDDLIEDTYNNYILLKAESRLKDAEMVEINAWAEELSGLDEVIYGPAVRKAHHFLADDKYRLYLSEIGQHCSHNEPQEIVHSNQVIHERKNISLIPIDNNVYSLDFDGSEANYQLYDVSGRNVNSGKVRNGHNRFNWSHLATGFYYLHIEGGYEPMKVFINP